MVESIFGDIGIVGWILTLIIALTVLIKASDYFVSSSEKIGVWFGVSPFIIGVTIVALGTSLPELITSIISVKSDMSEFVVGNVVGSNIANILLILGISALFVNYVNVEWDLLHGDLPILFGSVILLFFVVYPLGKPLDPAAFTVYGDDLAGFVTFGEGIVMFSGFIIYSFYSFFVNKSDRIKHVQEQQKRSKFPVMTVFILFAAGILIYFSADITIETVKKLSTKLNIGSEIIAASVIAFGTSLPELVVSITAVKRKNFEIAIGNITGSNLFNTFIVLGLPAIYAGAKSDGIVVKQSSILTLSLPFYIGSIILFLLVMLDKKITRFEGLILCLCYALFILKLFYLI